MKYLLLSLASLVFVSCSFETTSHNFFYHGTDNMALKKQFYYVAVGVQGRSQVKYSGNGGGFSKDGLVNSAKQDLYKQFPLGPNQGYANLSIDIMETRSGTRTGEGASISGLTLNCVVSADVIQYCDELPQREYEVLMKGYTEEPIVDLMEGVLLKAGDSVQIASGIIKDSDSDVGLIIQILPEDFYEIQFTKTNGKTVSEVLHISTILRKVD